MRRFFPVLLVFALGLGSGPAIAAGTAGKTGKPRVHVLQRGQTLAMIAKRYHVSVAALIHANDIHHSKRLKPKQKLIIPLRPDKDGNEARALYDAGYLEPHTRPAAVTTSVDDKRHHYSRKPQRPGYVVLHSTVGSWRGYAVRHDKVSAGAEQNVTRVLASWRSHEKHAIDERLIRMIAKVSDHFGGRPIRVVSGFRPYRPTQYTPHSQHNLGHAMDFSIPGVPNTAVRDFCRTLPRVGCGYYPNSSFVHMDVRDVGTYWVDLAGPGEPPRYQTVTGSGAPDDEAEDPPPQPAHKTKHHKSSSTAHGSKATHHRSKKSRANK